MFGTWSGTLANLFGSTAGASLCFLIARHSGMRLHALLLRRARLARLESLLTARGARGVMYLRLTPFVPFSALNYGFGLTRITFVEFLWGTFVGLVPKVWLGTLLGALSSSAILRGT